jgi:hypothetical protein
VACGERDGVRAREAIVLDVLCPLTGDPHIRYWIGLAVSRLPAEDRELLRRRRTSVDHRGTANAVGVRLLFGSLKGASSRTLAESGAVEAPSIRLVASWRPPDESTDCELSSRANDNARQRALRAVLRGVRRTDAVRDRGALGSHRELAARTFAVEVGRCAFSRKTSGEGHGQRIDVVAGDGERPGVEQPRLMGNGALVARELALDPSSPNRAPCTLSARPSAAAMSRCSHGRIMLKNESSASSWCGVLSSGSSSARCPSSDRPARRIERS